MMKTRDEEVADNRAAAAACKKAQKQNESNSR